MEPAKTVFCLPGEVISTVYCRVRAATIPGLGIPDQADVACLEDLGAS